MDNDPIDYNGHGTHCAGIAAAKGNNNIGISGVCPNCKIMPLRAGFSIIYRGQTYGSLEYDDIANAIRYAVDNGAKVISMSFGGPADELQVKPALEYAHSNGVVLIAAAGNSNTDDETYSYPAAYDEVISVAAAAQDDTMAYYSNYGYWVDVAAPGGDYYADSMMLSTVPISGTISDSSGYLAIQGTSMACPYVAGLAGLILSKNPGLDSGEVSDIITTEVDETNEQGYYIGTGRVNVNKALQAVAMHVSVSQDVIGLSERISLDELIALINSWVDDGTSIADVFYAIESLETEAYFRFDYPPHPETFVFKLTDPVKIQEARDILNGIQTDAIHVTGTIIKNPISYNPHWSYHLDSSSISFFEMATEVCDADIQYIEDNLDDVGGSFLPGDQWCPWGSRLIEEVAI